MDWTQTHLPEDSSPGRGLAGLAEGLARDWTTNALILLSLFTGVAGVIEAMPWRIIAPVVGVICALVAYRSIAKRWPVTMTWAALLVIFAVNLGLLMAMFT